ncbi:hypothetical protein MCUN1_001456 [Malassezia cuniculi]|uniref:Large ribosomal subunit protein bL21m n=1 Tax=Malassezia cuniculi TaxID=948313 RepID=A0AAF0EQQ4_9BASI|nr:hypothetical protein MCUN1_001456 [Malassezia cuniculi]
MSLSLGRAWTRAVSAATRGAACSTSLLSRGLRAFSTDSVSAVDNVSNALSLLRSQPNHYVVASIVGRTFVLSASDVVTVPRIRDVKVGDILELDRIHEVGSRDYTLRAQDPAQGRRNPDGARFPLALVRRNGTHEMRVFKEAPAPGDADAPVLPISNSWAAQLVPSGLAHVGAPLAPEVVRVRCIVTEHTMGPLERIIKFKRRKGYKKVVTHKQPYTRLRVDAITLGN